MGDGSRGSCGWHAPVRDTLTRQYSQFPSLL